MIVVACTRLLPSGCYAFLYDHLDRRARRTTYSNAQTINDQLETSDWQLATSSPGQFSEEVFTSSNLPHAMFWPH